MTIIRKAKSAMLTENGTDVVEITVRMSDDDARLRFLGVHPDDEKDCITRILYGLRSTGI